MALPIRIPGTDWPELREFSLFSGAGGGILGGTLLGWQTVAACEIEPFCREILLQRQKDGLLPLFPIWDDIKTLDGKPWSGAVDIVTAGFPCQPYSTAGKQKGQEDERNLWPDTIRCIREMGPSYVFLENVPGLLAFDYFGQILGDMAESGFNAEWDVVSAADCGAPHLRKRLWILAYAKEIPGRHKSRYSTDDNGRTMRGKFASHSESGRAGNDSDSEKRRRNERKIEESRQHRKSQKQIGGLRQFVGVGPDSNKGGCSVPANPKQEKSEQSTVVGKSKASRRNSCTTWWEAEPGMGRVADELADTVDRLASLGNGQVPSVVVKSFLRLARRAGIIDEKGNWIG